MSNWISVNDKPLFSKTDFGWISTDAGTGEFLAAVPYEDKRRPNQNLWWIKHCVLEDERGLCVVGDDVEDNIPAGWEMSDITHYQLITPPERPHTQQEIDVWNLSMDN